MLKMHELFTVFMWRQNIQGCTNILHFTDIRLYKPMHFQVILAGTLTGVQGDTRCKVLAVLFTVKHLELNWPNGRL